MRVTRTQLVLSAVAALGCAAPLQAATITPDFLSLTVPTGTNNASGAGTGIIPDGSTVYTDDVYIDELTFGGTTYTNDNFQGGLALELIYGRDRINIDWGDDDTGSDGDASGLAKNGENENQRDSTDPAVQDPALLSSFQSLSLTEMADGERGSAAIRVAFTRAISDNDDGIDGLPEIILFERGMNDSFGLKLIIGGTFENPVFSEQLMMSSRDFYDTGIRVNTTEIRNAQTLGLGAFDLNDWNLAPGAQVFGYEYEGANADLSGVFAAGLLQQFDDPIYLTNEAAAAASVIPLPPGIWLMAAGLGGFGLMKRSRKKA